MDGTIMAALVIGWLATLGSVVAAIALEDSVEVDIVLVEKVASSVEVGAADRKVPVGVMVDMIVVEPATGDEDCTGEAEDSCVDVELGVLDEVDDGMKGLNSLVVVDVVADTDCSNSDVVDGGVVETGAKGLGIVLSSPSSPESSPSFPESSPSSPSSPNNRFAGLKFGGGGNPGAALSGATGLGEASEAPGATGGGREGEGGAGGWSGPEGLGGPEGGCASPCRLCNCR